MTVVILTSGTSYSIPSDWTSTNQIETWAAGGGGSNGFTGDGGGSGGYSSISNQAGLSGSLTISIGTAGTGGASSTTGVNNPGGTGGATWFDGASLAASIVGSNGGTATAGGSTTGAVGTTKTAGSAGGIAPNDPAGAGAGAPGPAGVGAIGANGTATNGGTGGTGDNGSGGVGGVGGTTGSHNGVAGTANTNGAGGGGGGYGATGTLSTGGAGALPGSGGGGGGGDGTNCGTGGTAGGGQIRITYTPLATQITNVWTDLPIPATKVLRGQASEKHDFHGWQLSPISADSVQANGVQPTLVPPGRYNAARYQDWQQPPLAANFTAQLPPTAWTDLPVRGWGTGRQSYQGMQTGPIPAEYLVPVPSTDVPRGRYNASRYQDLQTAPLPPSVVTPPVQPFYDMPVRVWDRRRTDLYQGAQVAPQPQIMSPPQPVYDVPRGQWSLSRYQDFSHSFQSVEYQAPLPQVDVPRGTVRFDYTGWQNFPVPADVGPPLQSSVSTDLPVPSALSRSSRYTDLFQGFVAAPAPGNVTPPVFHTWLCLVGVGNDGP